MHKLSKNPAEKFYVAISFENVMLDNESLIVGSGSCSAFDSQGADVSSVIVDSATLSVNSTSFLQAKIRAGDDGSFYKLTYRVYTSLDNVYEDDILLEVSD